MEGLTNSVLAFLAAVGITALVWLLAGALLRGKRENIPVTLVLPACGGAEALEGWVRSVREVQTQLGRSASVAVVDCGLTREGRHRAELLASRFNRIIVLSPEELGKIIE